MNFDYYYGDESNQFAFYRIPRQLITGEAFKKLSTDAKLLYGLLLDRMGLSAKNGWYDDMGRVFIYYTLDEIQEDLNCGHEKAVRLLAELDTGKKGFGLIERVKQGQGRPTMQPPAYLSHWRGGNAGRAGKRAAANVGQWPFGICV